FMNLVHKHYASGDLDKHPTLKDMARTLLFQTGARVIKCDEFRQRLITQESDIDQSKVIKRAQQKVEEIQHVLEKKGTKLDWMIADLPKKPINFVQSKNSLIKSGKVKNVLLERDPVKISYENGDIRLLADVENSIISKMSEVNNYIPNVYVSQSAYELLLKEKVITPDC